MLTKRQYHLGQKTNVVVTEEKTKGQNTGNNSRNPFFPQLIIPQRQRKKSEQAQLPRLSIAKL